LVLHGHGLRARTLIVRASGRPEFVEILARRYVCRACHAVVLVVPAEVAKGHLYTLCAIAAALAAWSHAGLSARRVRAEHAVGQVVGSAVSGWPSLIRWARSAQRLWPKLGALPHASPRRTARAISAKLAAFAPTPTGRVLDDAVAGSVHAA
jgi:hypothetical protein